MLIASAASVVGAAEQGGIGVAEVAAYKNSSAPIEERVADLIARMTPTELIGQLMHTMGVPGDFNNAYIRNMTLQWGGLGGSYWCYTLYEAASGGGAVAGVVWMQGEQIRRRMSTETAPRA